MVSFLFPELALPGSLETRVLLDGFVLVLSWGSVLFCCMVFSSPQGTGELALVERMVLLLGFCSCSVSVFPVSFSSLANDLTFAIRSAFILKISLGRGVAVAIMIQTFK